MEGVMMQLPLLENKMNRRKQKYKAKANAMVQLPCMGTFCANYFYNN